MDTTTTHRLAVIIKDLRRAVLTTGFALFLGCLGFYSISPQLLGGIQKHLHQKLAFFTVAEPFLAHVTVSLAMTIFTIMPMLSFFLWRALAKPFSLSRLLVFGFVLFSCILFYSGAAFCYFVTLPFGINFLLDFQTEQLKPIISISEFVSFVSIFVLAFGLIFELPIFMIFMAKIRILPRSFFEKNRRYAALVISVTAALLTPTPDVFNMLLMGIPLYMLYEVGIIVLRMLRIP
ncbi:MAG: twin-arginine translocase subunit TatC [Pseudomonadota bacterium]